MTIKVVEDNTRKVLEALNKKIDVACEIIGGMAESYAKDKCPVKTGRLQNSITHGMSGAAISKTYTANDGSPGGSYSGNLPKPNGDTKTVIIGTNVEYAPYVELGTVMPKRAPHPFLHPAFEEHIDEYKEVLKTELSD